MAAAEPDRDVEFISGACWTDATLMEALALLDSELGIGYVDERLLRRRVHETAALLHAATVEERLVGVGCGGAATEAELAAARGLGAELEMPTATLSMLVVSGGKRHGGIGTALLARTLEALRDAGFMSCLLVSWVSGSQDTSDRMARRAGFVPLGRIDGYWLEDSLTRSYACPACGNPCRCAAEVMVLADLQRTR